MTELHDTRNSSDKRFVLLFHQVSDSFIDRYGRGSHWDLLLEHDGLLLAWAVSENPFDNPGQQIDAAKIHHHRMEYLDYEGPVSHDRGTVKRHDQGIIQWICHKSQQVVVDVFGEINSGRITLELILGDSWNVTFVPAQRH